MKASFTAGHESGTVEVFGQTRHLLGTQDLRQLPRLRDQRDMVGNIEPSNSDPKEEPQCRHRSVDGAWRDTARDQVKLP
jgi:hypothetical protein